MRKIYLKRLHIIGAIKMLLLCTTIGAFAQKNTFSGDPVYFSYKSACNVSFKFLKNKILEFTIDGKVRTGTIRQNVASSDHFDLVYGGKVLAVFFYDEGEIIIFNQQYQFVCEDAKGLTLSLVNDDQKVLAAFQQYSKDRDYIWTNIAALNDKAYYLQDYKCYQTSVYILEKIVAKDPERVVAFLNIGDSYWALHKQEAAKKAYVQYVSLMNTQGKNLAKIPQRVYDRIK